MKKLLLFLVMFNLFIINKANAFLPIGLSVGFKTGYSNLYLNNSKNSHIFNTGGDFNSDLSFLSATFNIRLFSLRFELEYMYRDSEHSLFKSLPNAIQYLFTKDSKEQYTQTIFVNGYYSFIDIYLLRLYVGGGLGYTNFSNKNNAQAISWNAGVGTTMSLLNIINLDVGYRYVFLGKNNNKDIYSNDIYAGIRIGF